MANLLQGDPTTFQWDRGEWRGTGGGTKAQQYYAWKHFYDLFGRNPSQSELDQLASSYGTGDQNLLNQAQGNSAVARYYDQMNPMANQQNPTADQTNQINQLFTQHLGRAATPEEQSHFANLLASGQYDAYDIGNMFQNMPEAIKAQDAAFRKQLGGELQASDAQYYQEQVMPAIQSNFAKQGRSVESSGFQQALGQAAQGQNRQREAFLSNLAANQYGSSQSRAYQDYVSNRDYTRDYYNQQAQTNQNRLFGIEDFNMQKQAYDQYLARYGKRNNTVSDVFAGINTAANLGSSIAGLKGAF